jgi:hypothetical protein
MGPNAAENVSNLKEALRGQTPDAAHIKSNLELLLQEANKVGGDIARLGIKAEDLQYIDDKFTAKAPLFGAEFPAELVVQLHELVKQTEQVEAQAETKKPELIVIEGGAQEINRQSERNRVESAVAAFYQWKEIFSDQDLSDTGSMWTQIDRGLTNHLNQLKKVKGLDAVAKGQLPTDVEDHFLDTLRYVQELKTWHDKFRPQGDYQIAA